MTSQSQEEKEEKEEIETRIQEACQVARELDKPNLAEIAREFKVDYQNFRNRYIGHDSRFTRPGSNKRFTDAQETALILYMRKLEGLGGSVSVGKLENAANQLLTKLAGEGPAPKPVSANWIKRFLDRHPELVMVTQKPLEVARMLAQQPHKVTEYFDRLQREITKYGIGENDLWNMDEAGFRIGMGGKRKIITFVDKKKSKHYLASEMDRESLTIIEAISAAGQFIPPYVIITAKSHLLSTFRNELEPSTVINTSEKGFTTDVIALDWLEHFDKRTKNSQRGEYRMLLIDGHGSHTTEDFVDYCSSNKIILVLMPPHLTHLLQPLDLKVFQPYKHYHRTAVNDGAGIGLKSFNKGDFLAALPRIRKEIFKYTTVRSAWREAGIEPWNPSKVLEKMARQSMREEEAARPTTPPHVMQPLTIQTPTSSGGLRRMCNQLEMTDRLAREFSPLIEKMMKGSVSIALSADVLSEDYRTVLNAQKLAREGRNGGQKRVRAEGGPIAIGTGRKIENRLLREAKDGKIKKHWERVSANLYDDFINGRATEAELRERLPAAMEQASTRKKRSDAGKPRKNKGATSETATNLPASSDPNPE